MTKPGFRGVNDVLFLTIINSYWNLPSSHDTIDQLVRDNPNLDDAARQVIAAVVFHWRLGASVLKTDSPDHKDMVRTAEAAISQVDLGTVKAMPYVYQHLARCLVLIGESVPSWYDGFYNPTSDLLARMRAAARPR